MEVDSARPGLKRVKHSRHSFEVCQIRGLKRVLLSVVVSLVSNKLVQRQLGVFMLGVDRDEVQFVCQKAFGDIFVKKKKNNNNIYFYLYNICPVYYYFY